MPTALQIENADPLTETQALGLIAKARASETFMRAPHLYPGLEDLINAKIGVDDFQSRQLAALSDSLDKLGEGTVALQGGAKGVNYSKGRDREALIRELLATLYDLSGGDGRIVFAAGSLPVSNMGDW